MDSHDFDNVDNFRDFGGYAAGSRRMIRGRFYRSAHLAHASTSDLARLAAMNISVVIDLRRPDEREHEPSRRWPGFSSTIVENDVNHDGEELGADGYDLFLRESDLTASAFRSYLQRYYQHAPFAPRHLDLFSRYFDALVDADGSVLVHCRGGKDRTGLLVALTRWLAGVHQDDIVQDYLATNDPERLRRIVPGVVQNIQERYGRAPSPDAMTVGMSVEAVYLDTAFSAIIERYGDIDAYFAQALGLGPRRRAAVEAQLLAS